MTILCGTDFSDGAHRAASAAAWLASRLGEDVALVHVRSGSQGAVLEVETRLEEEANALGRQCGVDVTTLVTEGRPDRRIVEVAIELNAQMIVVSSLGASKRPRWLLGSVAERVAQLAPMPVLVVRDETVFEAWARGESSLRVMLGVEPHSDAVETLRWAQALRDAAPYDLIVAQIAWPAAEQRRASVPPPMPLDGLRPELEASLSNELQRWVDEQSPKSETEPERPGESPKGTISFVVRAGWGRVDAHLIQLATQEKVDVLVVGTHQRAGLDRLWQGSVSRGVLHDASINVIVVSRRPGPSGTPS